MATQRRTGARRTSPWLSLGEAAHALGITPGTLRRWADAGDVPAFTTPGGHRRFARSVVEAMMPPTVTRRRRLADMGVTESSVTLAYRRRRKEATRAITWLERLSSEDREQLRARGRELVRLLLAYLDAGRQEGDRLLTTAADEAREYGRVAARVRASLTDTVQVFLQFRGPFLAELVREAGKRQVETREATALLMKAEAAMDTLLVSVMTGHSEQRPRDLGRFRDNR